VRNLSGSRTTRGRRNLYAPPRPGERHTQNQRPYRILRRLEDEPVSPQPPRGPGDVRREPTTGLRSLDPIPQTSHDAVERPHDGHPGM